MEEEKFNQKNISNLIRNILTLRYDPLQKTTLPVLKPHDFISSKNYDLDFIENNLKNLKSNILIYDPYFKSTNIFDLQTESNLIEALQKADALIIVTAHKEFHNLDPIFLKSKMKNAIVIDSKCIINQQSAKNAGLIYRGLGRGKI